VNRWINKCHFGDVRDVLRQMIADGVKVNTIVTSPPYWGLRSYLPEGHADKVREIGSEPTLREFIETMTEVMMLAREVLADDGTMWMNMGDSYAGSRSGPDTGSTLQGSRSNQNEAKKAKQIMTASQRRDDAPIPRSDVRVENLKPKDLVGQPWRLAFALQDAGWWLRQDIIWHKPNPMPESTRDRCTKAHEYIFLMSKSERYYFDQEAIKEPASPGTQARMAQNLEAQAGSLRANGGSDRPMKAGGRGVGFGHGTDAAERGRGRVTAKPSGWATGATGRKHDELVGRYPKTPKAEQSGSSGSKNNASMNEALAIMPDTRNKRSVWTLPTESYSGAHFATFPRALIEPCILAGAPPGGIVLDIFMGSGTTAQVSEKLGRQWIGIDIDIRNKVLQDERLQQPSLALGMA
jgi:DNA modification methylase